MSPGSQRFRSRLLVHTRLYVVGSIESQTRERRVVPIIQCDIRQGRTEEQKQALAQEITRVVHETIGSPIEYIYVLIRETPGSHHVKAGEALQEWTASPEAAGE